MDEKKLKKLLTDSQENVGKLCEFMDKEFNDDFEGGMVAALQAAALAAAQARVNGIQFTLMAGFVFAALQNAMKAAAEDGKLKIMEYVTGNGSNSSGGVLN